MKYCRYGVKHYQINQSRRYRLKILVKKNEAMSLSTKHPQRIQRYGKDLTNSRSSTYLGRIVTTDGVANEDIKARLGETRGPFIYLRKHLEVQKHKQ